MIRYECDGCNRDLTLTKDFIIISRDSVNKTIHICMDCFNLILAGLDCEAKRVLYSVRKD